MSPSPYQTYANQTAKRYGVDPRLVSAVIQQESGWNPSAKSPAGALGLMQLMPGTARGLGVDPMNWQQNIDGGVRYLADQIKRFGSPELALSAYNSGPGGAESEGRVEGFKETQEYVRRIMANLGGGSGGPAPSAGGGSFLSGAAPPPGVMPGQDFYGGILSAIGQRGPAQHKALLGAILGQGRSGTAQSAPAPMGGGGAAYAGGGPTAASSYGAQAMVEVINRAKAMGLAVSENPFVGDQVGKHTEGSHHYRTLGYVDARPVGGGSDIGGDPQKLKALFQWIRQRYPKIPELIYDPVGSLFDGTFKPGAYGGHGGHLHAGF